jgi:hypothetical protein
MWMRRAKKAGQRQRISKEWFWQEGLTKDLSEAPYTENQSIADNIPAADETFMIAPIGRLYEKVARKHVKKVSLNWMVRNQNFIK